MKHRLIPFNYFIILKTGNARQLLRSGYMVNKAASVAGFYNASHLHRLLRKFATTSPKNLLLSKSQFYTNFTA